jgi:dienelactone hydrolase
MGAMNQIIPDHPAGHHATPAPDLLGWKKFHYGAGDIGHWVYYSGKQVHPPLLLMCELAGFSPGLLMMAQRLIDADFQVYAPWLFGPFGHRAPLRNLLCLCIAQEFARLRAGVSAPITQWLRALSAYISEQNAGQQIGAIGMCLTGAFAVPLVIDPQVRVAVAAQPAVPISLRWLMAGMNGSEHVSQLNVSDADMAAAGQRLACGDAHVLACRFRADRLSTREKITRLRHEFSTGLTVHEYESETWRNVLDKRPHATFTKEYRIVPDASDDHPSRQAWADLLAFLNRYLPR